MLTAAAGFPIAVFGDWGAPAGLATALLWSIAAMAWSTAGRRVGAMAVSTIRITAATLIMLALHWLFFGRPWPTDMPRESLLLLAGSGALAAGFGDMLWFRSLVVLGPRVGMLIMSLCPVATAVLAYATPMRETLGATQIAGMLLTVAGVAWVIAEGRKRQSWQRPHGSTFAGGVFCAVTSTILVAAGMVMSRMALAGRADVSAFSGSLVRVAAASVFALLAMLATGRAGQLVAAVKNARAMRIILAGTVVGPVVGIWLSQVAIKLAPSGVATALIGTSPVMMVPLAYLFFGERPTASAVAGAVLATAGVAVMIVR